MSTFWRRVPLLISIVPAAALLWGFREALRPVGGKPPSAPRIAREEVARPGEFLLLGLGDSLTRGAGEGPGYASDVAQRMKASHPQLRLENLAVDGLESGGLKDFLGHPHARALAGAARVILLSIGGNDLSHAVPREMRGGLPVEVALARERLASNLEEILSSLRSANPSAPILLVGLYNPFSASEQESAGSVGSTVVAEWNASIEKIALRHRVQVIPIFDLFERRADRLSVDRFHPNRRGYELIAERVLQEL